MFTGIYALAALSSMQFSWAELVLVVLADFFMFEFIKELRSDNKSDRG